MVGYKLKETPKNRIKIFLKNKVNLNNNPNNNNNNKNPKIHSMP